MDSAKPTPRCRSAGVLPQPMKVCNFVRPHRVRCLLCDWGSSGAGCRESVWRISEAWARRFALGCGLPDDLIDAVARAGLLHDTGKADSRFQSWLNGGRRLSAATEPLAKSASLPKTGAARSTACIQAGYPAGGRHELLSVRLAESAPELLPDDPLLRELTLFLVSSHHGHCRPFAPVVIDDSAPEVSYRINGKEMKWSGPTRLEHLKAGTARRFWLLV